MICGHPRKVVKIDQAQTSTQQSNQQLPNTANQSTTGQKVIK